MVNHLPVETTPELHSQAGVAPSFDARGDSLTAARKCLAGCHALLSDRDEMSRSNAADAVRAAYESLDAVGRTLFFEGLARELCTESGDTGRATTAYDRAPSEAAWREPQRLLEGPRRELFVRLLAAPGGTAFLVQMRGHVLQGFGDHRLWEAVDADLLHALKGAFRPGSLEFRRLDWDTPAAILGKLIEYEAVHAIRDWRDLRRRLEGDRRCYAFFHPAWPGEPLIFTEIALTCRVAARVQPILAPSSPVVEAERCDTALFYSITNCQPGLRGLSFGNHLIGRVLDQLRTELPRLRTFATLSPIPGFRPWLTALSGSAGSVPSLRPLLATLNGSGWLDNESVSAELEHALLPLCAHFLLHAKQGTEPADPVARFHLGNGARLRRINWLGDVSLAGIARSAGLTANYLYHPTDLARNGDAYARGGKVNATREIEHLARLAAGGCKVSSAA